MARVFISHSSADMTLAAQVHRWLVDDGHDVFLDQDLGDGVEIRDVGEKRLHERLRGPDAMVCMPTVEYVGSERAASDELVIAQSRASRLLPIRAESGVRYPVLTELQEITERLPARILGPSDQGATRGFHRREGSLAVTRFYQGQWTDGGQYEQPRRRHCESDGDGGGLDDRYGARGGDGARLRCRGAKRFYQSLGWRLDADFAAGDDARLVQMTPPHSQCSIHFGKGVPGITAMEPGSLQEGVPGGQGHRRRSGGSHQPRRRRQ